MFGVGLRLLLAVSTVGNFDLQAFRVQGDIVRAGGNVYAEFRFYNYAPLWMYAAAGLGITADALHIPFPAVVRIFLTVIDVINAALIAKIAQRPQAFAAYLLNPVTVLLVGYGGQFEVLTILPLLAAVWLHQRGQKGVWVWVLATLSLLIKHLTLFGVWMLFVHTFGWRRGILRFTASAAVFVLSFAPFLPQGAEGIYNNVLRYASEVGFYGFGMLLPRSIASLLMFGVLLFVLPALARRLRLELSEALLLSSVGMIAVLYGFAEPYLMLVMPWAVMHPSRWLLAYTTACLVYIGLAPWQWVGEIAARVYNTVPPFFVGLSNLIWLTALGWMVSYWVKVFRKT
jgi:hypothetical protein